MIRARFSPKATRDLDEVSRHIFPGLSLRSNGFNSANQRQTAAVSWPAVYTFPMRNGNGHGSAVLEKMLEPVSRSFGLKTARALAALRVGGRTQARVEKLAEKCNEGKLTANERAEYEAYVQASTLIGNFAGQSPAHPCASKSGLSL